MSDEEILRRSQGHRRLWDNHGSWVILVAIGICCFMAGSSFSGWTASKTVDVLVKSHERQDSRRVKRIRELIESNKQLSVALGSRVERAVENSQLAADKAVEAVERAGAPK